MGSVAQPHNRWSHGASVVLPVTARRPPLPCCTRPVPAAGSVSDAADAAPADRQAPGQGRGVHHSPRQAWHTPQFLLGRQTAQTQLHLIIRQRQHRVSQALVVTQLIVYVRADAHVQAAAQQLDGHLDGAPEVEVVLNPGGVL
jgi:hypothetical protein